MYELKSIRLLLFLVIIAASTPITFSQTFTKIVDSTSPIISDSLPGGYIGTAWIDFNNDGKLDLFVNNDYLYKNEGNTFSKNLQFKGRTRSLGSGNISSGSSWADYDNDGDIDMFSTSERSFLFQNNNDETFTRIDTGTLSDSIGIRGWGCAWGDYDNDGNIDLLVVHAANFTPGAALPNLLFHNDGPPDYNFTKVTSFQFTSELAPYTVATWSDYDMDGDIDLFFASGPGGSIARDYIYKNMLKENGFASFQRINTSPIGTDLQNGQNYNIIDYDNDGDLDIFLTNYSGADNRLYRNDGGTYTSVNIAMNLSGVSCLANTWGDFNNDGFLDVLITSETATYYYQNDKDGTFSLVTNSLVSNTVGRGATIGDYDNDGDLDVCIVGRIPNPNVPTAQGIYRNNTTGNNWKKFKLIGSKSNKAAIGAMVRLKANIDGTDMWLTREIAAQNSFNSQNSLDVHFGLGNSSNVDTVIIQWPSGARQVLSNIQINTMDTITEPLSTGIYEDFVAPDRFELLQNYPNPFNPETIINYSLTEDNFVKLEIFNLLGEHISSLINEFQTAGNHSVSFNVSSLRTAIPSGIYFYKIQAGSFSSVKKMTILK